MVAAVAAAAAPACSPQQGLGAVAYTTGGALKLLDLATCRRRTLVAHGAGWPVRFSHDGKWIGFGSAKVVSVHGGKVLQPIGPVYTWAWSPKADVLAGLTSNGAVVQGAPGRPPRVRAPPGWGAQSLAWSPDGLAFAVGRARFRGVPSPKGLQQVVLFFTGRGVQVGYQAPKGQVAPPQVVGWAPLPRRAGTLIFFQPDPWNSASIAMDGLPLYPLNAAKGMPLPQVAKAVLPVPGFFVPCGGRIVVVSGRDRNTETNKQIVVGTFRPGYLDYRMRNLSRDPSRAWVSPACSPDGRSLAVAAGPDRPDASLIRPQRSLWLLSLDGRTRRALTRPPAGWSDDGPLWAANGKAVFFTRQQRPGRGALYEVTLDGRVLGPLARLRGALVGVGVSSFPVATR